MEICSWSDLLVGLYHFSEIVPSCIAKKDIWRNYLTKCANLFWWYDTPNLFLMFNTSTICKCLCVLNVFLNNQNNLIFAGNFFLDSVVVFQSSPYVNDMSYFSIYVDLRILTSTGLNNCWEMIKTQLKEYQRIFFIHSH